MNEGPNIKGNPLKIFAILLAASYILGEFFLQKYFLFYFINLLGILGLIVSVVIFFISFNIFNSYNENPAPNSSTNRIIKTSIFAYSRNPMYFSFILFHISMFLVFENVMYFLSALFLFIWLNYYVINIEEDYLIEKFPEEYKRYKEAVKRWFFF